MEEFESFKIKEEKEPMPLVLRIFATIVIVGFVGFYGGGIIAGIYFIFYYIIENNGFTPGVIVVFCVVGLLILMNITVYLYLYATEKRRKIRKYRSIIQEIQEDEEVTSELSEDILEEENMNGIKRPRIVIQKEDFGMIYPLDSLIYKEKVTNEKCQICKLEMRKKEVIVQCPICDTLFHKDHFLDWMVNKKSCPVCGEEYAIETHRRNK